MYIFFNSVLRHSGCVSSFEELGDQTKFQEVLGYWNHDNLSNCESIFFCSGKFVYDILGQLQEKKSEKTALYSI